MKIPYCPLATVLILQSLYAQTSAGSIDGLWEGALLFGQGKVRVLLYLSTARDGSYSGAMVDLESGTGSNIDTIALANGKVSLGLKSMDFKFEGTVSATGNQIKGKFTRGETSGELTLTRDSESHSTIADKYEKHEYMIPMRDGIHLHTIVFSPKVRNEALPFLIERSRIAKILECTDGPSFTTIEFEAKHLQRRPFSGLRDGSRQPGTAPEE